MLMPLRVLIAFTGMAIRTLLSRWWCGCALLRRPRLHLCALNARPLTPRPIISRGPDACRADKPVKLRAALCLATPSQAPFGKAERMGQSCPGQGKAGFRLRKLKTLPHAQICTRMPAVQAACIWRHCTPCLPVPPTRPAFSLRKTIREFRGEAEKRASEKRAPSD